MSILANLGTFIGSTIKTISDRIGSVEHKTYNLDYNTGTNVTSVDGIFSSDDIRTSSLYLNGIQLTESNGSLSFNNSSFVDSGFSVPVTLSKSDWEYTDSFPLENGFKISSLGGLGLDYGNGFIQLWVDTSQITYALTVNGNLDTRSLSTGFGLQEGNGISLTNDNGTISISAEETTTSLSVVGTDLKYTDEEGTVTTISLATYLDDTNLSRIVSGQYDANTNSLVFTRDDSSSFSIDASVFFDDTNLVTSVAGRTGAVTLTKSDVGLNNVDNTSDLNKPISNATETAINAVSDRVTSLEDYNDIAFNSISSSTTLAVNSRNFIESLTTSITLTLPSAQEGDKIWITDVDGSFDNHQVTITSSLTINGYDTLVLDKARLSLELVFATNKWVIV